MEQIQETTHATIASAASKGMMTGGGVGIMGWLTSDAIVGLIGLAVAVIGLLVNIIFRWLDSRHKREALAYQKAKLQAEEERARELHELKVQEMRRRLDGKPAREPKNE